MYCPQCGNESPPTQRFCRSCGANLKVIGKAVALSEAVARSDRGPLPKIKEMMKSIKVQQTTDEISQALEQMNKEIALNFSTMGEVRSLGSLTKQETLEQRRENHIVKGTASFFSGIALMIFLYYFSAALVLKIPPEKLARIPFELEPVLRIIWLIGLLPALSGIGRIVAGLLIKPARLKDPKDGVQSDSLAQGSPGELTGSVTEGTTELLKHTGVSRSGQ